MHGAVAVDLGATSGRFAAGRLVDGKIEFEVVEQIPHAPQEHNGRLEWRLDLLLDLCRRATEYAAEHFSDATIGIDAWGVDHGFLNSDGTLHGNPVCYRDTSHARAAESIRPQQPRLYELTGIQYQPFNTINQLLARRREDRSITDCRWLMLPDLLGYLLGDDPHMEYTQSSTTGLQALDGGWSDEAFEIVGWPVPHLEPLLPGTLGAGIRRNVRIAHVGSHDTASAVAGFGTLRDDQVFLNVGTWSLVGTVLDHPIATDAAREANFTNERCVDGRVRFLKNVPGFYIINRLHDELGVAVSVPDWLLTAKRETEDRIDFFDEALFNPESMVAACTNGLAKAPASHEGWAELALRSLVAAVAQQPAEMSRLTGRTFTSIRVGGGGCRSEAFCRALAEATGLEVHAEPVEATVLGNLAAQFLAAGHLKDWQEAATIIDRSVELRRHG